jgi:hypothetical protein
MIFSNRGWPWKVGAALALAAVFGVHAAREGLAIKPSLDRALAQPERWEGHTLWIAEGRVLEAGAGSWSIGVEGRAIRVSGPPPGPVGSRAGVSGVFRAAGPLLEVRRVRVLPEPGFGRRWTELLSLAVLGLVLFHAHRAFRPDWRRLQVEGRD